LRQLNKSGFRCTANDARKTIVVAVVAVDALVAEAATLDATCWEKMKMKRIGTMNGKME
jgi:protein tyrosine/serine phosphatase